MHENVRKATRANVPINDCTPHIFKRCSDLPNLGRLGIFSCDACDRWRTKDITGRRIFKPRSEMKSFFCTRELKGMGPIRIRVVCGVTNKADENRTPPDNHNNNVEKLRRGPKRKALTPALLSPPVSVECTVTSKIAKEVDERLKLEKEVSYLQGEFYPSVLDGTTTDTLGLPTPQGETEGTDRRRHMWNTSWERRFHDLLNYKAKHGTCHVPSTVPVLWRWVRKQRDYNRLRASGKCTHITLQRLKRLDAIGFVWDARKKRPTQEPDMWNTLPKTQGGSVGSMVTTRSRSDINVENERMSNQHLSPTSRLNKELEVQRITRKNNKKSSRLTTHSCGKRENVQSASITNVKAE
jgi:hypothetical protein